jgi:hypothetical protein
VKIFLLLLSMTFISCGKAPLFKAMEDKDRRNIQALNANDTIVFEGTDYHFGIEWNEGPYSLEKSSFTLRFWDKKEGSIWGPYLKVKPKLCVFLWMLMPDGSEHGSAPLTINANTINSEETAYFIDEAYFIMNGPWQIRVRLIKPEQACGTLKSDPYLQEKILDLFIN